MNQLEPKAPEERKRNYSKVRESVQTNYLPIIQEKPQTDQNRESGEMEESNDSQTKNGRQKSYSWSKRSSQKPFKGKFTLHKMNCNDFVEEVSILK